LNVPAVASANVLGERPMRKARTRASGEARGERDWRSSAILSALLLCVALVFGGGTYQRSWPDAIVQIAALLLIPLALQGLLTRAVDGTTRLALLLVAAIVALPLLQLVPLPPSLWAALPGRKSLAEAFRLTGTPLPWFPLTLSPAETWRSALGLIPPLGMFLSAAGLDRRGRRRLTLLLIVCGFACVLIGLAQVAAGSRGLFRFYGEGTAAVGFFINRNHYAALLYVMIPLTAAWIVGLAADHRREMLVGICLCVLVFCSILLGLGVARSRAGLGLAMLAALLSLPLASSARDVAARDKARFIITVAGIIGALLIIQFALLGILQRLEADPLGDMRWTFTAVTLRAAHDFLPFGAGLGTFDSIYKGYETAEMLTATYVNNAHNDFAELYLEAGIPALLLVALFVTFYGTLTIRVWFQDAPGDQKTIDLALRRAATIVVLLLSLHSFVDYPLRSAALASIFALACALMLPAAGHRPRPAARAGGEASILRA
jgi:hypothetical protein